jgi:hypothetical protein
MKAMSAETVTVAAWRLRRVAEILDRDGDEHGVAADLWSMLADGTAQAQQATRCWCAFCDTGGGALLPTRMSVCPDCGDKRCARAWHHSNSCSKTPNARLSG